MDVHDLFEGFGRFIVEGVADSFIGIFQNKGKDTKVVGNRKVDEDEESNYSDLFLTVAGIILIIVLIVFISAVIWLIVF